MEMPRMKTREANKTTKPGVNAGLEKKSRRNAEQMAEVRAEEAASKAEAKREEKRAVKRLAALEDKLRNDDIAHAKTANRPVDRPVRSSAAIQAKGAGGGGGPADDSGSGDDSEPFIPPDEDSSSSSSEDETDDDSEEDDAAKKKKKPAGRADVTASRRTQDPSGTPAVSVAVPQKKRKNKSKDKKSGKKQKTDKKKSGLDKSVKDHRGKGTAPGGDDDSMVAPGGPAMDDDPAEHVEKPKAGKKKRGVPTAPLITIQAAPPKAPTRKEVRGGTAKWTLQHLPPGTSAEFTDEVVPLARELVGTLNPWAGLTIKQIQDIVDIVYGAGVHKVTAESTWVGLLGYRLTDWRSAIAARALKAVDELIDSYEPVDWEDNDQASEEDKEESDDEPDAATSSSAKPTEDSIDTASAAAPATVTADASAIVPAAASGTMPISPPFKITKFTLGSPSGVAAFVAWALEPHAESNTMPFHWKTWGGGVEKQGFLQSHLIVYTFAYHMSSLATIPGGYKRREAQPVGALLLSVQAVQRALELWKSGEYVNPHKSANHFSVDNWGDTVIASTNNQKKGKLVRRATKFLSTVQEWKVDRWDELKAAAAEWVELPTRRRSVTASRSGSEAGDDAMLSDDDIIMVLSD
ncbi:hypothetical protein DFH06DRAFT_1303634 [Mycena polygramma]|nr:hypothetical protein DFH06DRAFT_1303634 [Mycena polygramma]